MSQLNANIPYIFAYIRDCYLFSDKRKSLTACYIFGVKAELNRPLRFHCQLENGAVFWSLPISAFTWLEKYDVMGKTEEEILSNLEWWDCQSSDIAVTTFSYLEGYNVDYKSRCGTWYKGTYLFTIDDYYSDNNSLPVGYANDSDSKCFHVIQLDNGRFALSPNNFLRWHNLNFCEPYDLNNPPKYKAFWMELRAESRTQ